DHHSRDLFSELEAKREEAQIDVAIDANVFFDLEYPSAPAAEESQALLADWLQPLIRLHLTGEILNEINRKADPADRATLASRAKKYPQLPCPPIAFYDRHDQLRSLFPAVLSEQDESDLRHLARAIASGFLFFVTRDEPLLSLADIIYERHGVSILRPVNLITRLD